MTKLPNLFRTQPKAAERLYSIHLGRLQQNLRDRSTIAACQRIRALALRTGRPRSADFTYAFEIDARCRLRDYSGAWRALRRLERIAFGQNIDLKAELWTPKELDWFAQYHPHILYFRGKYELARQLYETMLSRMLSPKRKGLSYDLLGYVYNSIARPRQRQEVTLYHVYRKLGKKLAEWESWKEFVLGFDPRIFALSGIKREDLMCNASHLPSLCLVIKKERARRLTAGVTTGESELIAPPSKVWKYQEKMIKRWSSQAAAFSTREPRLEELFPDIRTLR